MEWKRFRDQWRNYEIAADLNSDSDGKHAAISSPASQLGKRTLSDVRVHRDEQRRNIDKVVEAFNHRCIGEIIVTYERYVFNRRTQEVGEPFDAILSDVRLLARTCLYGMLEDSIVRDRIVIGMRDNATWQKLLQIRKLDLPTAVNVCRASEIALRQLKSMASPEDVHRLDMTPKRSPSKGRARSQ